MKRRITDDVSVSEMLEMRAQGMSNKDIARSLEISYVTVLRHIGRQDGRMESIAALEPAKVRETVPEPVVECIPPRPFFKVGKERLTAGDFTVHLDYESREIGIMAEGVRVQVQGYDKLVGLMEVIGNVLARVAKEEA